MNDVQASSTKVAATPSGAPVALITGASAGIGEATVHRMAKGGFRIFALARRADRLEKLAKALAGKTAIEIFPADVTARDTPQRAVDAAIKAFGRLDCLVNNAGSGKWGAIDQTDENMLDEVVEMGLKAPFRFCRAAIPALTRPGSSIINVGSSFGITAGMYGGIYTAVKTSLIGLTRAIAVDYGAAGIRSNLVAPGVIRTEMVEAHWEVPFFRRLNHEQTPYHRDGTVEDIASAIHFLASQEGSYINGQVIALDGGWTTTKFICAEALARP
jgi:3-oxoacyl-[acyl-carrier protein] reductase